MRRRRDAVHPPQDPEPESLLPLPHLPLLILLALAEGARHGSGVIDRIAQIGGAGVAPSSGSLYLAMGRLVERGLILDVPGPTDADTRRRHFDLTSLGRRVLAAETERLAALVALSRSTAADGEGR